VALVIREHKGRAFYEAKFRHDGHQIMRRIGPAWLERDEAGEWNPRRGRVPDGFHNEQRAHVRAAELVRAYVAEASDRGRSERERRARGITFREVASGYLRHLEDVKGARPSTLRQHRSDLAEPDVPYERGRGRGVTNGHIMRALGDRPAKSITAADVEVLLRNVADSGVTPRTVNRVRAVVSAVFNFGMRSSTYALPQNPTTAADRRREPHRGVLVYYAPDEVEAVARALSDSLHRARSTDRTETERAEDHQDAEAVRVAAYAGIRLGELLALRWHDVDWTGSALTISRAMSAGVEGTTKSGHARRVPLSDQAAAALERLSRRGNFTGPDELVFCSSIGRTLDGSALRRRYKRGRVAAGLRPLRWHDLRHTFGSLLAANGIDLVTIKDAMGHADLKTTERYLHAKPATETAARFTAAFSASSGHVSAAPSEAVIEG
jgi:integrase